MKRISVIDLAINHTFTKDVYLDKDLLILTPFSVIDQSLINRLYKWKINSILTDGELVEIKSEEEDVQEEFDIINFDSKIFEKDENLFLRWTKTIKKLYDNELAKKGIISPGRIMETVSEFIDFITKKTYAELFNIFLMPIKLGEEDYLIKLGIKFAIMSLVVGEKMKFTRFMLLELGCAALLQDVSLSSYFKRHSGIDFKNADDNVKKIYNLHPALSFKLLEKSGYTPNVTNCVLNAHENILGTGFPRNIKGERMPIYATVLSFYNSFHDYLQSVNFRLPLDVNHGFYKMLINSNSIFNKDILRWITKLFFIFIPESYLKVQGIGYVKVNNTYSLPKKLRVVHIFDDNGKKLEEAKIIELTDLSKIEYLLQKDELDKLGIKEEND